MSKYLVETYYTCTFKVNHHLDSINETELKNLEKDFKIRTEVLDKSRNEKFTEVVPQLAEWYENIKL